MKNIKKLKFTWHSRFTNYKWVKITNESLLSYSLGVSKKTGKPIKPEKKNRKNRTEKKNRLNRLHFWKNRPVRFGFGFISKKPKKPNRNRQKTRKQTEPNRKNRAKTEPNRKNRAKPKKTEPKPEKTEPKPRKPSQNRKNRAKPVWTGFCPKKTEPNRTETGRFDPVSVRFRFFFQKKKISVWLLFLIKTEPNRKWSPLVYTNLLCLH